MTDPNRGPYSVVDFHEWKRRYAPPRSVIVRAKIARRLFRLASRIDNRPNVKYTITHHHPKTWNEPR